MSKDALPETLAADVRVQGPVKWAHEALVRAGVDRAAMEVESGRLRSLGQDWCLKKRGGGGSEGDYARALDYAPTPHDLEREGLWGMREYLGRVIGAVTRTFRKEIGGDGRDGSRLSVEEEARVRGKQLRSRVAGMDVNLGWLQTFQSAKKKLALGGGMAKRLFGKMEQLNIEAMAETGQKVGEYSGQSVIWRGGGSDNEVSVLARGMLAHAEVARRLGILAGKLPTKEG